MYRRPADSVPKWITAGQAEGDARLAKRRTWDMAQSSPTWPTGEKSGSFNPQEFLEAEWKVGRFGLHLTLGDREEGRVRGGGRLF